MIEKSFFFLESSPFCFFDLLLVVFDEWEKKTWENWEKGDKKKGRGEAAKGNSHTFQFFFLKSAATISFQRGPLGCVTKKIQKKEVKM